MIISNEKREEKNRILVDMERDRPKTLVEREGIAYWLIMNSDVLVRNYFWLTCVLHMVMNTTRDKWRILKLLWNSVFYFLLVLLLISVFIMAVLNIYCIDLLRTSYTDDVKNYHLSLAVRTYSAIIFHYYFCTHKTLWTWKWCCNFRWVNFQPIILIKGNYRVQKSGFFLIICFQISLNCDEIWWKFIPRILSCFFILFGICRTCCEEHDEK